MSPNNLLARLREWWQSQNNARKIGMLIACVAVLVTLSFLFKIMLTPTYAPLFTQLDPAKAGEITEELDSMGVSYKLTNDGQTLEIPQDRVHNIRVKLASSGVLVGSGKGFELFDKQKFGISDFEQKVAYQRALQEELRRTIVDMDGVQQARVHLVLPEDNLFSDEKSSPSAAVALKLSSSVQLKAEQVSGIVDLVTGSVQGISSKNVNIIDMEGNILNNNLQQGNNSNYKQPANHQQLERKFETQLEGRLRQLLTRILGPGEAVAMVTADLNFDQKKSSSTVHGPGAVVSEQNTTEEGAGSGSAEGVPPDNGENSGFPGLSENSSGSTYNSSKDITNYEVDIYKKTMVKSPGEVNRLSIALVIDEKSLGEVSTQEELNQKLGKIQNLVASAVGYDATRGDQITVSSIPFETGLEDAFNKQTEQKTEEQNLLDFSSKGLWIAGSIAVGLLLVLLLLFFILRGRRRKARKKEKPPVPAPAPPPEPEEPIIPTEPDTRDKIRKHAKEKPEEIAEIIKLWLKE
ncbi:MAG: flagellar M-ring protein FliF [Clostridiales bacterium]|nr:flagellar M-ring protein FliF [Clostridiales bacterium]MCF8021722.1 flagellar M-ring protein FliF [Clostridiales bacterium]